MSCVNNSGISSVPFLIFFTTNAVKIFLNKKVLNRIMKADGLQHCHWGRGKLLIFTVSIDISTRPF